MRFRIKHGLLHESCAALNGAMVVRSSSVRALQARLDTMKREMTFLIHPNSKKMQYWDMVTLAALFLCRCRAAEPVPIAGRKRLGSSLCCGRTLTMTPYEVALLSTQWDALLVINQLINAIFILDIIVNCLLPYREPMKNGAGLVRSHSRIIMRCAIVPGAATPILALHHTVYHACHRYAMGWMVVDIVSVLPFDILVAANVFGGGSDATFDPMLLRTIRLIRLLRLLKLFRILKASRILQSTQSQPQPKPDDKGPTTPRCSSHDV